MSPVLKITQFFFDRKAVIDAVNKATIGALSKAGRFIRRSAQTSMGYRKSGRSSPPGSPPRAHKEHGARLRKLLFYAYEPTTKSVVVGPVRLGTSDAPTVEEFGGTTTRTRILPRGGRRALTPAQAQAFRRMAQTGQVIVPKRIRVSYPAKYPPRPYMGPALEKEIPFLPSRWANAVKAS